MAPEHLSLQVRDPENYLPHIRRAGAVFANADTPVACGDYLAGTNHVLPTSGAARFSSGLSTADFLRSYTVVANTRAHAGRRCGARRHCRVRGAVSARPDRSNACPLSAIRLVAFDLDGTMIGRDSVRPRVIAAIEKMREAGVAGAIATGRMYLQCRPVRARPGFCGAGDLLSRRGHRRSRQR